MNNKQLYEMITALSAFVFIGSAAFALVTLFHLQFGYMFVWVTIAVFSAFSGLTYYGKYEDER